MIGARLGGLRLGQELGAFGGEERVDEFVEFAVEDFAQAVGCEEDAVVGYSALGVVVGADFFGAVAAADL